jgi:pyruvate dehydrogenase E2 component (dihydrolipoamide acetyltransferase)
MSKEFKLPELGENIESADVISVLVKAGDKIEKEQGIIEIETDKATVEVPSSVEGVVKEVLVKQGDKIKVGQVLIKVDENGKEKEDEKENGNKEKEGKTKA